MRWTLQRLEDRRTALLRKLANPKDHDDPEWVKRRLAHIEFGIAKKQRTKEQKQREKKVRRPPAD